MCTKPILENNSFPPFLLHKACTKRRTKPAQSCTWPHVHIGALHSPYSNYVTIRRAFGGPAFVTFLTLPCEPTGDGG